MRRHCPVSVVAMAATVNMQEAHINDASINLGAHVD